MTPAQTTRDLLLAPISTASPEPLYLQIINSLKREVSEGRLTAGAPLPSFRKLAEDLLVSVITVKRAYEELEREGIIYRRQGLGTFVAEAATDRSREAQTARAIELFREGVRAATQAGLGPRAILRLVQNEMRPDAGTPTGSEGARHARQRA